MSYTAARARYAADTTDTASPARLLTMLYDRLISDLAAAEAAMRRGEIAAVGERIGRAQEILLELASTLDTETWPGGEPLRRLYLWMVSELWQARLRRSAEKILECRQLVEPLRDAWRMAAIETTQREVNAAMAGAGDPS
jgi:flagellar secretion chaperone FliS